MAVRERSPPRGDRRPLSKRNKPREQRAAAGGASGSYGQIRAKALEQRSKTVPAEVFIGEVPKRSKAVPPNASALRRQQARTAATKRTASVPAEDTRVRPRGGPANAERAAVRQKLADNGRLYEDKQGNIKSKRVAKTVGAKTSKKGKGASSEFDIQTSRPEDKYGVRGRTQRAKSSNMSRSRERVGVVV